MILSSIPIRWFSTRTDSPKKSARHVLRDITYHSVRVCARECVLVWLRSRQQLWPLFGTIDLLCLRTINHFNKIFYQRCVMLRMVCCWILNGDNYLIIFLGYIFKNDSKIKAHLNVLINFTYSCFFFCIHFPILYLGDGTNMYFNSIYNGEM